jgi:hypothetical protein
MPKLDQPYMIAREAGGGYRIISRDIRYNDDGFPAMTTTFEEATFRSAEAARDHARTLVATVSFKGVAEDD